MLAMQEVFRVLKPDGEFLLADFGIPHNYFIKVSSRITNGMHDVSENMKGIIPLMMDDSGFMYVEQLSNFSMAFGTITMYVGKKAAA